MAGCEYADLERMVRQQGIEPTLERLRTAGVYVTIDEFKCRRPIVRGATTIECTPSDFDNPFLTSGLQASSSGSRGPGTVTTLSLERISYVAFCQAVACWAHGLLGRPAGVAVDTHVAFRGGHGARIAGSARWGFPLSAGSRPLPHRARPTTFAKRLATLRRARGTPVWHPVPHLNT